jgi:hypothetical protein
VGGILPHKAKEDEIGMACSTNGEERNVASRKESAVLQNVGCIWAFAVAAQHGSIPALFNASCVQAPTAKFRWDRPSSASRRWSRSAGFTYRTCQFLHGFILALVLAGPRPLETRSRHCSARVQTRGDPRESHAKRLQ